MIFSILIICDIITAFSMSAMKKILRFRAQGFNIDDNVDSILDPFSKKNVAIVAINTLILISSFIVIAIGSFLKYGSTIFTLIILLAMSFYSVLTDMITRTVSKKWVYYGCTFFLVSYVILIAIVLLEMIPAFNRLIAPFIIAPYYIFLFLDSLSALFFVLANLSIVSLNTSFTTHKEEYKDRSFKSGKFALLRKAFINEDKVMNLFDKDKVMKEIELQNENAKERAKVINDKKEAKLKKKQEKAEAKKNKRASKKNKNDKEEKLIETKK